MARCRGVDKQGNRCKNQSRKGKNFCRTHEKQIITRSKKIRLWKIIVWAGAGISFLIPIVLSYYDFLNPRLSLEFIKTKSISHTKLVFKNESNLFSIVDVNIKSIVSEETDKGFCVGDAERSGDVINGVKMTEISKIPPGNPSVKIYDNLIGGMGSWMNAGAEVVRSSICLNVTYKADFFVWKKSLKTSFGGYFDSYTMDQWERTSCDDLPIICPPPEK
jgi:hypothetical protein